MKDEKFIHSLAWLSITEAVRKRMFNDSLKFKSWRHDGKARRFREAKHKKAQEMHLSGQRQRQPRLETSKKGCTRPSPQEKNTSAAHKPSRRGAKMDFPPIHVGGRYDVTLAVRWLEAMAR